MATTNESKRRATYFSRSPKAFASFSASIHEIGLEAYENGYGIDRNPYKADTRRHYAWYTGWCDGAEADSGPE